MKELNYLCVFHITTFVNRKEILKIIIIIIEYPIYYQKHVHRLHNAIV